MKIPRPRRPRLSAKKVYATVEISGLAAIVVGVAMIYPPAAVILAGIFAVVCAFALEPPTPPPSRE